ncbi:MAG TPA: hypothetical protein VMG08_09030 [Allosphingosinicella sp.]|nr:hypothetical protein [Allosphingosinicella sp.]
MSPIVLVLAAFAALPLAFFAGRVQGRNPRLAAFLAVLILPILVYTALFFSYGAAARGNVLHWWLTGLMMLGLPLGLWFFAAIGGFALGMSSRKPS